MHAQSRLSLCDHMDYSLPGSSVHGSFQARILEGLPFPTLGDLRLDKHVPHDYGAADLQTFG